MKFGRCVHLRENEKDPFMLRISQLEQIVVSEWFPTAVQQKNTRSSKKKENTKKELSVFNDIGYICTFSTADFQ